MADGCSVAGRREVDIPKDKQPHHLVTATAVGNRVFLLTVAANSRQWRVAQQKLRAIQDSFWVPAGRSA